MISILGSHPNNTIRLYLDGIFAAEAVDSLTILRKDRHKLQAVQVEDGSAEDVLFLASSTNGINSDKQWRCTNAFDEGWFLPNYTDISWPKVFVVANNTGDYFIAPEAKWIGYEVVSNRIYCRRTLTTGKKNFNISAAKSPCPWLAVKERLVGLSRKISFPFKLSLRKASNSI